MVFSCFILPRIKGDLPMKGAAFPMVQRMQEAVASSSVDAGARSPLRESVAGSQEDATCRVFGHASPDRRLPRPKGTTPVHIVWNYVIPIVVFHLLLPLACMPYFFTWTGLLLVPIGNYVFCSLGIGAGFHRLLTHRSYKCPLWFEHLLAILGTCSLQQAPARWVLIHRMHHQHSDHPEDPHSPMAGWFWGHMGWVMLENRAMQSMANYEKYAKDLLQNPFYMLLERSGTWFVVAAIHALLFFVAGYGAGYWWSGTSAGALRIGLSILLWGVVVRTVYSWHITWGVNSVGHMVGYRNYDTDENSRNNWLFAILTNGDGWHNNHHADPRAAAHGFHRWWEFDLTYLSLRLFERLGIVTDIVPIRCARKIG